MLSSDVWIRRSGITQIAETCGFTIRGSSKRYHKLLRAAIAETASNEADLNDEMRYLVAVLRRR